MFKKLTATFLAVLCVMVMSLSVFAASAGDTVTADCYIDWKINTILNVTAHLTDTGVPPTTAPSKNAVLETPTSTYPYQVTIHLNNTVLALEDITLDEVTGSSNGTAQILSYTPTADSYRDGVERIDTLTVGFTNFDEEYVFEAEEYANEHPFVKLMGQVGSKNFDLTVKVSQ